MSVRWRRRLALCLACVAGLSPLLAAAPPKPPARPGPPAHFRGKVVPLADLVAQTGSRLDPDAAPYWLALAADDGKVYPLVKDDGARLFFKDRALLNRPMRLTGRLLPGSQILQVIAAHSLIKGELHEIYYWCDVCSIKRGEKNICECCGGPMELHEDPVKPPG
jgi:hypothetical protein